MKAEQVEILQYTLYLTSCSPSPSPMATFIPSFLCRENDNLLSRLSQSILRSEEVPAALEAMQVQHITSHHMTSRRNRYPYSISYLLKQLDIDKS
jgi:hypothetical protein